jgi:hypothetical protein
MNVVFKYEKSGSAMVCLSFFSERFPHKNSSLNSDPTEKFKKLTQRCTENMKATSKRLPEMKR